MLQAIELERRRCTSDFSFFARQAWHTIEPATKYVHGYHIEAIVDHLTACLPRVRFANTIDPLTGSSYKTRIVEPGHIRKLLVNMPPRHMKSSLVSVLWPAWVWTFRPEMRWLFTSYALALSIRDTMKMRAVLSSPWYQTRFSSSFRLLADQNEKSKFFNTSMGYRISGSVDAGVTGEGGDVVVVDDPHNVRDADSEATREATKQWWFEAMSTRLNDAATGSFIVVMQRVHEKDLAAECRDRGYVHLNLPARFDVKRKCVTSLGWEDWRQADSELLWPERFSDETLRSIEETLGEYGVNAQLQQDPKPRGGAFIKRDWFKRIPASALEAVGSIAWGRAWDLALSKTGDRVASVEIGMGPGGETYLRRGLYWREDWAVSLAQIGQVARSERGRYLFESIGTTKSAGQEAAKVSRGHCVVDLLESKENKVSMAMPWIARAQAGKIFLVEETEEEWALFHYNSGSWIEHFLNQFAKWIPDPSLDQEDDEVDSVSLAFFKFGGLLPLDEVLADMAPESGLTSPRALPFTDGYEEDFEGDEEDDFGGGGMTTTYRGGMM